MGSDEDKKIILLRDKAVVMSCEEVYQQFEKYLHSAIKSYVNQYEYDDMFQVASIGLIKAYKAYDANKELLFMTFLSQVIVNELNMYVRKHKKHNNVNSLDSAVSTDEGGKELTAMELISDDVDYSEVALTNVYNNDLSEAISLLSEREQAVINGMFFNDLTQPQLANKLGYSQSYISRLLKETLVKLNRFYIKGGTRKMDRRTAKKITREQLLEECRQLGTDKAAIVEIGGKYGCTFKTIITYIGRWGIRNELSKGLIIKNSSIVNEQNEDAEIKTNPTLVEDDISLKVKEVVKSIPVEVQTPVIIETVVTAPKSRMLKPTLLTGKVMEYRVLESGFALEKLNSSGSILLANCEIDDFIKELQELKEYRNAV